LRLTGVPVTMLRRVVVLEAAAPFLVSAVASAGTGLLAAELFLQAQLRVSMRWPAGSTASSSLLESPPPWW